MKKIFAACVVLLMVFGASSQKLGQVSFLDSRNLSFFSIQSDYNVLIRISVDGRIMEWGTEVMADRGYYYAPKLQPFMGRVEYYGNEASDSVFKGKIKSIGTSTVTYYGSYDEEKKRGKVKTLGMLNFDYYSTYDEKSVQGKLKMIGNLLLEYYRQYENEAYRGKLSAIGSLPITYYTAFDDKYNAGKIKSIGSSSFSWYSEYERARGSLKSNNYRQNIGGINFVLR